MSIINKVNKETTIQKKVNFKESILTEMKLYAQYIGFDLENIKDENEAISYTVNEALKYVLAKDKDYKKFKEIHALKNVDTNNATN
jgi:hypothetical protein